MAVFMCCCLSDEIPFSEILQHMIDEESDPSDPDFDDHCAEENESSDSESEGELDEEIMDKFQLEIEEAVSQFRDEVVIPHHMIPESDDEAVPVRRTNRYIRRTGDGTFKLEQFFPSSVAIKEAVLDHALKEGTNIKQYRWDDDKIGFKCGDSPCEWRLYAAVNKKYNCWEITVYIRKHTCKPNGKCKILKDPVIARLFLDKVREDPDAWKPKKIRAHIADQWSLFPTPTQCAEARRKCLKWIKAEYEDQFAHIRGYCKEILESNPGSTVAIETVPGPNGDEFFDRFYVCFDALKRSWKTLRPLIGIDGTFLRGNMKGQLLVAIGRDNCNKMYPIAWGIVGSEDEPNWIWFVRMLKYDLDLGDGEGFVVMSDRQKGLCNAVHKEIPKAEHRKCVRHIYGNIKAIFGRKMEMKPLIWTLAWSYNKTQYEKNLKRLQEWDLGVFNEVMKRDPETWCLAFYKNEKKCLDDVENNTVESFNNSIVKAREKLVMPMLETIRRLAMERIQRRSAEALRHMDLHTPYVNAFLSREKKQAAKSIVHSAGLGMYEVRLGYDQEVVNLKEKTCSCCKWDICGIPCEHTYGVILNYNLKPEDYVSDWFLTSRWRDTYAENINPIRGPGYWATGDISLVAINPDMAKQKKKKEKRKRGKNESPTKKKGKRQNDKGETCADRALAETCAEGEQAVKKKRVMHCSECRGGGHNTRTCPRRKDKQVDDGEAWTQAMSQVDDA